MFMASYPRSVRQAVSNEKNPSPGLTKRLIKRWSCSIRLWRLLALPQFARVGNGAHPFEFGECLGIRRVFVHSNDAGSRGMGGAEGFEEKPLGCLCLAGRAQQELGGIPCGVHCSVQIHPCSLDLDGGNMGVS